MRIAFRNAAHIKTFEILKTSNVCGHASESCSNADLAAAERLSDDFAAAAPEAAAQETESQNSDVWAADMLDGDVAAGGWSGGIRAAGVRAAEFHAVDRSNAGKAEGERRQRSPIGKRARQCST